MTLFVIDKQINARFIKKKNYKSLNFSELHLYIIFSNVNFDTIDMARNN